MKKAITAHALVFLVLLVVCFILVGRDLNRGEFYFSDESRHAMDGVFIYDLVRDAPPFNKILGYALQYYGCYPAIALGHYPPFFAVVEAVFFAVFGISVFSARLTVLFFLILGAVFFYKLLRRIYPQNQRVVFYASLFYITTPFIIYYSKSVMLEIPALSMILASMYYFHRLISEPNKPKNAYLFSFYFIACLLTKQNTIFMIAVFLSWFLWSKQYTLLRNRHIRISFMFLMVFIFVYFIYLWKINADNIARSIGIGLLNPAHFSLKSWGYFPKSLLFHHVTVPIFLFSLGGLIIFVMYRKKEGVPLFFLAAFNYIFASYCLYKEPRFGIFWIPAFCAFAAEFIIAAAKNIGRITGLSIGIGIIVYQLSVSFNVNVPLVQGYRECAAFCSTLKSAPLLFSGYHNGNFIFFMRILDISKRPIIRASKTLAVFTSNSRDDRYKELVKDKRDIMQLLKEYGIRYIVVEDKTWQEISGFKMLRELLTEGEDFKLLLQIPVVTELDFLKGVNLLVYEYRKYTLPKKDYLDLDIFLIGRRARIPLKRAEGSQR